MALAKTTKLQKLEVIYQIKLMICVIRHGNVSYRNEMVIPARYLTKVACDKSIQKELRSRIELDNFFRSPLPEYDIVKYTQEATCNTFLKYCIIETLN